MAYKRDNFVSQIDPILKPFDRMAELSDLGFATDIDSDFAGRLHPYDEQILLESALAPEFYKAILTSMGLLLRGHLAGAMTYPGKFGLLLSDDPGEIDAAMVEFQHDYGAFEAAKSCGGKFWTAPLRRSPMLWTFVQETFELMAASGWKATGQVVSQCRRAFSFLGSTYPVEFLFQKAQDHADRDNANKRLSPQALWYHPTAEKFLQQVFDFKQVFSGQKVEPTP